MAKYTVADLAEQPSTDVTEQPKKAKYTLADVATDQSTNSDTNDEPTATGKIWNNVKEFANTPAIPFTKAIPYLAPESTPAQQQQYPIQSKIADVVTAPVRSLLGTAEQLSTPLNATIGAVGGSIPAGLKTVASGAFIPIMARAMYLKSPEFINALKEGDISKAVELGTDLVTNGYFSSAAVNQIVNVLGSPSVNPLAQVPEGLQNATEKLAGQRQEPTQIGQGVREQYNQKIGEPLNQILAKSQPKTITQPEAPILAEPVPPKSGQEIFAPEYNKVAGQINPNEVPFSKGGQTIKESFINKFRNLYDDQLQKWNKLNSEHSDASAPMTTANQVIGDILDKAGEPTLLSSVNPQLREAALKQANPEAYLKELMARPEMQSVHNLSDVNPEEPSAKNVHIDPRYSLLKKIYEFTNNPDTTFSQVHGLQGELEKRIDRSGRGDAVNADLINASRALGEDKIDSAINNGFGKEAKSAISATRQMHRYEDLPTSKIIAKANYPSEIPNKIIDAKIPEVIDELYNEHLTNPDDQNVVQRMKIDEMNRIAKGDPDKFINEYDKMTPEVKTALFKENKPLVDSLAGTLDKLNQEEARYKSEVEANKSAMAKYNQELGQANRKQSPITKQDILSKDGYKLDQLMQGPPSTLVDTIQNQPIEMVKTIANSLGKDGTELIGRGIIQNIAEKAKTKLANGRTRLELNALEKGFGNLDDEFIKTIYGEKAPLVQAVRDASRTYNRELQASRSSSFGLPTKIRQAKLWINLFSRFKLPNEVRDMLTSNYGQNISDEVIPPQFTPATTKSNNVIYFPSTKKQEDQQ